LEKSHSLKINHTINLIDLTEEYKDKINEYIEVNPYCQTYQILNYIIPHLFKSYTVIPMSQILSYIQKKYKYQKGWHLTNQ